MISSFVMGESIEISGRRLVKGRLRHELILVMDVGARGLPYLFIVEILKLPFHPSHPKTDRSVILAYQPSLFGPKSGKQSPFRGSFVHSFANAAAPLALAKTGSPL